MMQPENTTSTSHSTQDTASKEYANRNHDADVHNHNDFESDNRMTTTATSSNSMVDSAALTSCTGITKSFIEIGVVAEDRSISDVCPNNDNSKTTNNSNSKRFHRMRRFLSPNITNSTQHIQSATDVEIRGRVTTTATMLALDDHLNGEYELDDDNSTNDLFVQQRNTSPRNNNNNINNTPIDVDDTMNDDHHHVLVDTRSNSVGRFRARDDDFIFMMMNNNNIGASSPISLSDNRSSSVQVSSNSSRRRRHQQDNNNNFNQHIILHPNEDHDEYSVHTRYDIGRDSGRQGLIRPRRILHLSQAEREEMLLQRIQKRQEREDRQNERHLKKRESSQSRKGAKVVESGIESSEIEVDDSNFDYYETETRRDNRPWLWKRASTTQSSTPSSSSLNDDTSTTTSTTTNQQNVYPNRQHRNQRLLSVKHVYAALEGKGRYNDEYNEFKEEKEDETFKKVSIIQQPIQDHPLATSFLVESNGQQQQPSPLESLTTEQRIQDACSFFYQNSIDYNPSTTTGKIPSQSNHRTRPSYNFEISSTASNTENYSQTTSSYYPWRMIVPRGSSSHCIDHNYNNSTNEMYNSFGDDNNYNYNYYRSSNFNQSSPDRAFRNSGSYSQPSQGYFRRLFTVPSTFGNNKSNNNSIGPEHQQSFTNYHPFNYSDAVPVLAPPVLQRYLSKFEQFNEPIVLEEDEEFHNSKRGIVSSNLTNSRKHLEEIDEEESNYHELQLSESEDCKGIYGNTEKGRENAPDLLTADTIEVSALFYECDGRILMKLPRDRVKLVHDPDIQPGILSVEQWRHPVVSQSIDSHGFNCDYHTDYCKEDLRYTLSVPDNIYRKIVSEMSYRLSDKFGFYHGCCSSEDSDYYYHHPSKHRQHQYHHNHMHRRFDKVDIRVAVYLLLTFLFILCFFTLWYNEA